jgi:SH3 domain-containing YSC84-like protein 1
MIRFKPFVIVPVAAMVMVVAHQPAEARRTPSSQIELAASTIEDFVSNPAQRIPPKLLQNCRGIAVIPGIFQAGFFLGGRRGSGIVMVRDAQGRWSNPAFITLTGGSFGLQFGAQSSDVVLVFRSKQAITKLLRESFTLGGSVSVAAGPAGNNIVDPNDPNVQVYSYARNKGLFAGVALEGAKINFDQQASDRFYGQSRLTVRQIFNNTDWPEQPEVTDIKEVLAQAAIRRREPESDSYNF